jgi:hypothetical protein
VIYYANKAGLHGSATIQPGERLRIPAKPGHIPAAPAFAAAPVASVTATSSTSTSTSAGSSTSASTSAPAASTSGDSAFQSCVIERESGGNAQVMNSSGHYGLYQFSLSTWEAYGGSAADFGHASVAEQNQVFANAMAAGGEDNWAPYDGC